MGGVVPASEATLERGCPTCELNRPGAYGVYEKHLRDGVSWPDGKQLAVSIVFNYQGAEGMTKSSRGYIDYETAAEREYGPKVGIWRCLRALEEFNVPATFLVCGATAELYPETVRAIADAGHEVAGHSYHHERAVDLTREEEEAVVDATTAILNDIVGEPIVGWRNCHQSRSTAQIAMDRGFLYNGNSFYYDLPYLVTHGEGVLVEIPRQPFGDMRTYGVAGWSAYVDSFDIWKDMFDTFYEEALAGTPGYAPLSLHPFITGRPGRVKALSRFLDYVRGHEGIWFARQDEIARHVLGLFESEDSLVTASA